MSAKFGSLSIYCLCTIGTAKTVHYTVAGCPLFRGKVNGRAVGIFRIVRYSVGVRYSGVSVKRGSTVAANDACLIISHLPTQSAAKECNCRVSHVINLTRLSLFLLICVRVWEEPGNKLDCT